MKKMKRVVVVVLDGAGAGWQHDAAQYGDEGANTLKHVIEQANPYIPNLEELLDALCVPEHPGRGCLKSAVALAWADRRRLSALKAYLYPEAARQSGLKGAQCERAICHVIDCAFRTGEIERQHEIFGDTIDARRGKPTGGEMIAQLAEELRWEG